MQLFIEIQCERRGITVMQSRASSRGTCVLPAPVLHGAQCCYDAGMHPSNPLSLSPWLRGLQ